MVTIPFNHDAHTNAVKNFIIDNDMECDTGQLPNFGAVTITLEERQIVGYMGGHRKYGSHGHLDIFVVQEGLRSNQIGSMTALALFEMFTAIGIKSFTASVMQDNDRAVRFYRELGIPLEESWELKDQVSRCAKAVEERLKRIADDSGS
jgi:ribosomal protein S18 acetylase RimI-like enzyme